MTSGVTSLVFQIKVKDLDLEIIKIGSLNVTLDVRLMIVCKSIIVILKLVNCSFKSEANFYFTKCLLFSKAVKLIFQADCFLNVGLKKGGAVVKV